VGLLQIAVLVGFFLLSLAAGRFTQWMHGVRNEDIPIRIFDFWVASDRYIDYYGRPWAKNWEKYFEVGWDRPQETLPQDILDLFK